MAVDKEHSEKTDSEERASKEASSEEKASGVPRWLVVTAALALTIVVIVYGYLARPKPEWIGVANKNVWDWLKLLVVPAALAVGVYWLNTRQAARQQREADRHRASEKAAQDAQAQHALDVGDQRAQDAALRAYLDQMSQLLIEKDLRNSEEDSEVRTLARARTLTTLTRLDGERKGSVMQFLYESGLLYKEQVNFDESSKLFERLSTIIFLGDANLTNLKKAELRHTILKKADLSFTDLRGANLCWATLEEARLIFTNLSEADLSEASLGKANLFNAELNHANLSRTDLTGGVLSYTYLNWANLSEARLEEADLSGADLRGADLKWADLSFADLSGADLRRVDLLEAVLSDTVLRGADLRRANLRGVQGWWSVRQLRAAKTFEEATMPDGNILGGEANPDGPTFDEWVKDREDRKGDTENA